MNWASYKVLRALALAAALSFSVSARAVEMEKLEHCRLLENAANDGDSFHVRAKGKEFIFRLYFVDTPEVEADFPERVKEQAAYFGISSETALRIGKAAAQFTHTQLAGKEFTVWTRWQDARGESKLPRNYAFIYVGKDTLEELLVANGLARVFGTPAVLPTGQNAAAFRNHLLALEIKAKSQKLGAWSKGGTATQAGGTNNGTNIMSKDSWDKAFQRSTPAPTR